MPKTRNGFYVWCAGLAVVCTVLAEPLGWIAGRL